MELILMSVYACSDLHGNLRLFHQIKEFLNPEDKVYVLGDMGDRNKKAWCWQIIKEIMSDSQFIVLKGNHEDMLVSAMKQYCGDEMNFFGDEFAIQLLYSNGGANTFDGWVNDGAHKGWITQLDKLPLTAEYTNKNGQKILMSHAGYTPGNFNWGEDLLWDRSHIYDKWPEGKEFENTFIVHGHTPAQYINEQLNIKEDTHIYCEGHKIDLDCWTAHSHTTVLLNLDTLTLIPFVEKFKEE
jgi:hypothetical protein